MPNIGNWIGAQPRVDPEPTFDLTAMLSRRGQLVKFYRNGAALPEQRCIVAPEASQSVEIVGESTAKSGTKRVTVIGLSTLDVKRGDLFSIGGAQYRVTFVDDLLPGRREASAEAVQ